MTRINRASTYSGEDPPAISVKTIEQVIREQGGQQLPPGSVPEDRVAPSTTEGDVQVTEQGKTQWTASENLSGVITARDEAASAAADAATAQAAADAAQADADTVAGDLSAHITDTTAHPAAYITVTDAMAYYAATNVEDALEEAAEAVLDHVNDTSDAHDSSAISFDDTGLSNVSASDVQGAIEDLDASITAMWAQRASAVEAWASSTLPSQDGGGRDSAVLCYGQAISRTTYSELFARIGTSFGSGDGVTTFNVPDLRGRVWAGLDNMGGSDAGRLSWANTMGTAGGEQTHVLTTGESGQKAVTSGTESGTHYHIRYSENGGAGLYYGGWGGVENFLRANTNNYTQATGVSTQTANHTHSITGSSAASAHNIMQPTITGNYIIWTGKRPL